MSFRPLVVTVLLLSAVALTAAPSPASADDAPTWSVAPASASGQDGRTAFDYSVSPGAAISDTVAVHNLSGMPATFLLYAGDATTDSQTGAYSLVPSVADNRDLGAWVAIDGSGASAACATPAAAGGVACDGVPVGAVPVTLAPNAQALVPFTITVPPNAAPGDHDGGIVAVFRSAQPADAGQQPVVVEQRLGSRVHVRVAGALTAELRVSGLTTDFAGGVNPVQGDATTSYTLSNAGNVRLDATVETQVSGPFGIPLYTLPSTTVTDLLPGKSVTVRADPVAIFPGLLTFTTARASATTPGGGADAAPVTATVTGWAVS